MQPEKQTNLISPIPPPDNDGFTLIEIMIVTAIISTLAGGILVAIDPPRRFVEARNAERWAEVESILSAVKKYTADNLELPPGIDSTVHQIGQCGTGGTDPCSDAATECVDLEGVLLDTYLAEMPYAPGADSEKTHYSIQLLGGTTIKVRACDAEQGEEIYVAR